MKITIYIKEGQHYGQKQLPPQTKKLMTPLEKKIRLIGAAIIGILFLPIIIGMVLKISDLDFLVKPFVISYWVLILVAACIFGYLKISKILKQSKGDDIINADYKEFKK